MRSVITASMFLACLLYGFLPALAAMPAPGATPPVPELSIGHMQHAAVIQSDHSVPSAPCPHHSGMAHVAFCAACLTLPATVAIDLSRSVPFAYPAPGRSRALDSVSALPLLPPPRG